MVKGTELWDDSALISAFDAAMTSYKEMHNEYLCGRPLDKEKDDSDNRESDTVLTEEAKSGRQMESECNGLDVESNIKETCTSSCNNAAATNDPFTQENDVDTNSSVPEFNLSLTSEQPCVNPKNDGYSNHQNLNYNELLKQYNELEHKKEKIVEQLWQANYWNYQTQVQYPTSQQQQVSVISGSELGPSTSCSWCTSQCPMSNVLSVGSACCPQHILCCSGSQFQQEAGGSHRSTNRDKCSIMASFSMNSMNSMNHVIQGDDIAIETGAMPVELVRNSVKADLSRAFNLHEEKKNGADDALAKDFSSTNPKTDLTSVINAWYWAGYHTGRYLLEQEQPDKLNKHTVSKEKDGCS